MSFKKSKTNHASNGIIGKSLQDNNTFSFLLILLRDPKDPVVIRVRLARVEREDRRATEVSLVCRVCLDLR